MSHRDNERSRFWFPAQRYGWGWGMPSTRQGRLTLIVYLGLIIVGAFTFLPEQKGVFLSLTGLLTLIFITICWVKGEPPRWRWGDDNND